MASEHDKVKLASPAAARLISTKVGSGRDEATFMRTDTVSSDQEQVETAGVTPSDRAGSTGPVAAPLRGVVSDRPGSAQYAESVVGVSAASVDLPGAGLSIMQLPVFEDVTGLVYRSSPCRRFLGSPDARSSRRWGGWVGSP